MTAGSKPSSRYLAPSGPRLRSPRVRTCKRAGAPTRSIAAYNRTTSRVAARSDRPRQVAGRAGSAASSRARVRGVAARTRPTRSGCSPPAACRSSRSIRPIRRSASARRHSRRGGRSASVICRGWPGPARPARSISGSARITSGSMVCRSRICSDRLERAWGAGEIVAFPPAGSPAARSSTRIPAMRLASVQVDQLVTFVDLSPVFALRAASQRAARGRDRRARDVRHADRVAAQPGARVRRRPHRIHGRCGRVIGVRTRRRCRLAASRRFRDG